MDKILRVFLTRWTVVWGLLISSCFAQGANNERPTTLVESASTSPALTSSAAHREPATAQSKASATRAAGRVESAADRGKVTFTAPPKTQAVPANTSQIATQAPVTHPSLPAVAPNNRSRAVAGSGVMANGATRATPTGPVVTRRTKRPSSKIYYPRRGVVQDYVIGPQDVLAINVWGEPEISRVVPVRRDGKISLALAGEMTASGLTPVQLQTRIAERLKNYIYDPQVSVGVQDAKSQFYLVLGEVGHPGSYLLGRPMSVLDALAVAGGVSPFAKKNKLYVLRRLSNGSLVRYPFDYNAVIKGKKAVQNIDLRPGDTIVVP